MLFCFWRTISRSGWDIICGTPAHRYVRCQPTSIAEHNKIESHRMRRPQAPDPVVVSIRFECKIFSLFTEIQLRAHFSLEHTGCAGYVGATGVAYLAQCKPIFTILLSIGVHVDFQHCSLISSAMTDDYCSNYSNRDGLRLPLQLHTST